LVATANARASAPICDRLYRWSCSGKLTAALLMEKGAAPSYPMPETNPRPPDGLPTYRVLTGPDDAAFCHRVSEAVAPGYELYGSLGLTYNGEHVIVAQALVWASVTRDT